MFTQRFTILELTDLALQVPEIGAVNFNILHTILSSLIIELGMDGLKPSCHIQDETIAQAAITKARLAQKKRRASKVHTIKEMKERMKVLVPEQEFASGMTREEETDESPPERRGFDTSIDKAEVTTVAKETVEEQVGGSSSSEESREQAEEMVPGQPKELALEQTDQETDETEESKERKEEERDIKKMEDIGIQEYVEVSESESKDVSESEPKDMSETESEDTSKTEKPKEEQETKEQKDISRSKEIESKSDKEEEVDQQKSIKKDEDITDEEKISDEDTTKTIQEELDQMTVAELQETVHGILDQTADAFVEKVAVVTDALKILEDEEILDAEPAKVMEEVWRATNVNRRMEAAEAGLRELSFLVDIMLDKVQDMEEQSDDVLRKTKVMFEEIGKFLERIKALEETTKTLSLQIDDCELSKRTG